MDVAFQEMLRQEIRMVDEDMGKLTGGVQKMLRPAPSIASTEWSLR
ncbi:MAG: hypothetical protein V2J25_10555 [Desulfatiglans sp.]|jgi:hypothetical protein|nr:hypothetical protein [Thermodesulfobacteriota bacterium]MEE4353297.1 hypothetical protein [Desulfatiglans sp.]